jgi:serine/threonine protein phosphatase 1
MKCFVSTLPENKRGRDFIVGDIHGHFDLLDQALDAVQLNPDKDRLISVGDLINRGPQSKRCLEFLGQPWFHAVRGNHEVFFNQSFKNGRPSVEMPEDMFHPGLKWAFNEGAEKIHSMEEAFARLPLAIELETRRGPVGIVHADIPPGMNWKTFKQHLDANDPETIRTATDGRERINSGNKAGVDGIGRVFFGHTPRHSGKIQRLGNCYYLDTAATYMAEGKNPHGSLTLVEAIARKKTLTRSFAAQRHPGIQVLTEHNKTLSRFRRTP